MKMIKIKKYKIIFYKDENGKNQIKDYMLELNSNKNNNKNSKIKFNKIISYMKMLQIKGLSLGEPYIKHIENEIWELRPLRDRILFAKLNKNKFILLNIFMKCTDKTPRSEIEKAKRYLKKYKGRGD